RRGDGSDAGDPYDLNQDAVWSSCTAQVAVPNDDWRGAGGLISYSRDDTTLLRLDRSTWDVTNQARHWFYDPDYLNNGLVLLGYDEGTNFSNDAECISALSNVKLSVQFAWNGPPPTPTPTPNLVERAQETGNARAVATPTARPADAPVAGVA